MSVKKQLGAMLGCALVFPDLCSRGMTWFRSVWPVQSSATDTLLWGISHPLTTLGGWLIPSSGDDSSFVSGVRTGHKDLH